MNKAIKRVLVVGGGGYVGAVLAPKLVAAGYDTRVFDLFIYGEDVFNGSKGKNLEAVKGDVRDLAAVKKALKGVDAVIHLACISNDPSFELDPNLGRSINYDCFAPLVDAAKEAGVKRFVFASTSSVYGVSESPNVDEKHPLKPLTDYSKYKGMCEQVLHEKAGGWTYVVLRPATVCGFSPRLRLDLSVNILTNHAVNNRKITVFGGSQKRPNIHIDDVAELYVKLLEYPDAKINGETFNAGYENHTITQLATLVRDVVERDWPEKKPIQIVTTPTDDLRSYHISSDKIRRALGYEPKRTIEDAVSGLVAAFKAGRIPNSMTDPRYFNIKTMQLAKLR
jgi:nucleoside-diphosphate-sugar epimerase